jgi:hypothetical protein
MYNARNYTQELFFSIRRFIGIFKIQGILKDYYPPMYNLPGILGYRVQNHYNKKSYTTYHRQSNCTMSLAA